MIFGTCNIDSTYVKSKLRRFDMTWAAKIETTVISILAAPDLYVNVLHWNCRTSYASFVSTEVANTPVRNLTWHSVVLTLPMKRAHLV